MKFTAILIGAMALAGAARAEMPPAKPAMNLPAPVRNRLLWTFEQQMTQVSNRTTSVEALVVYSEQDGASTYCGVARFGVDAPPRRFVFGVQGLKLAPNTAEWRELGCTRPDALNLRG